MACVGLCDEDYHLWPLGLLDGPKTKYITAHIAGQCAACGEEVWEGLDLWARYGAAASHDPKAAPSAGARARLLENIRRTEPR